ncbi:unnamed protein product [Spirodela intermedia]|uniref:DCD domain-containing protein n=1 Tax=Spirodela intermedia TaxID=51605 RepID=A0A7I8KKA7_SPIIN|nr:unnamed protein product [Spirodela intermedia]
MWPVDSDNVGNSSVPARNLSKPNLGGVIFGCKHHTISECLTNQLFGLPGAHISYVRKIEPGLPLFLFNYSDRKLHGIFEAASHGRMNIDPYGWTEDGKERSPYPAQVRFFIKTNCQPIGEDMFRPIISDNYYNTRHFYFELDHAQVRGLLSLFTRNQLKDNARSPFVTSKGKNVFAAMPTTRKGNEGFNETRIPGEREDTATEFGGGRKSAVVFRTENSYASLILVESGGNGLSSLNNTSNSSSEDRAQKQFISDQEEVVYDMMKAHIPSTSGHGLSKEGEDSTVDLPVNEYGLNPEERVLLKLKMLALERNSSNQLSKSAADEGAPTFVSKVLAEDDKQIPEGPSSSSQDTTELVQMIKELKERMTFLEKKQVESEKEVQGLRKVARECCRAAQGLAKHAKELESKLGSSMSPAGESSKKSSVDFRLTSEELVYIIGGFDGDSWLSALDSYSLSLDLMTSLRPMSSARSYASAAALDGRLYVFGGGDGSLWYNTAECYDPRRDEWGNFPPLVRGKGSLAGVTLNGKVFAIGGGNGVESFSDVEMIDPILGRWIKHQSMIQKRFALAAAELGGAIYSVGGFDGEAYLRSGERFDPREGFWARIPGMKTARGCHSMAVLDGKLHVVGGYDGSGLSSGVEVFDPRASSWYAGAVLNMARGYAAAAVVGGSLYAIGGVTVDNVVVDVVERYSERTGWAVTDRTAVGQRSFFSAIVM